MEIEGQCLMSGQYTQASKGTFYAAVSPEFSPLDRPSVLTRLPPSNHIPKLPRLTIRAISIIHSTCFVVKPMGRIMGTDELLAECVLSLADPQIPLSSLACIHAGHLILLSHPLWLLRLFQLESVTACIRLYDHEIRWTVASVRQNAYASVIRTIRKGAYTNWPP